MNQVHIGLSDMIALAGMVVIPIAILIWRDAKERKKDSLAQAAARASFLAVLRNFNLHVHTEPRGPLTAEGIRYPKENGS